MFFGKQKKNPRAAQVSAPALPSLPVSASRTGLVTRRFEKPLDLTLAAALASALGDDDLPSVFVGGNSEITSASYRSIMSPAAAIANYIATNAVEDVVELIEDSQDTGAGSTATTTLQTAKTAANGAHITPARVYAVEVRIGLQGGAAGTGTAAVTAYGKASEALANTVSFRYPSAGDKGEEIKLLLLFGVASQGRYRYSPAILNPAGVDGTNVEIAAHTISIAWTGMPQNTKIDATVLNLADEQVAELVEAYAHVQDRLFGAAFGL